METNNGTYDMALLDALDRTLLVHLDFEARLSLTELASRVGTSKQVVKYRLDKLVNDGIIKRFFAMIDVYRLGLMSYRVYFRYSGVGEAEEQAVVDYLVNHDHTLWVVTTSGSWDLEAVFLAQNFVQFNTMLKKLRVKIGKYLSKTNISMSPVTYHFQRTYLVEDKFRRKDPHHFGLEPTLAQCDELDLSLLKEVSTNCRETNEELSRRCGVSSTTIHQRLERLETSGVIAAYRIMLDLEKLGRQFYKIMLFLRNPSPKDEEALHEFCSDQSCVVYLTEVLGDWQMEIEVEVQDRYELQNVLKELRSSFSRLIVNYDLLEVIEEKKINYFPLSV